MENLTTEEIALFNEFKEFLKAFDNGEYSIGDAIDVLDYFNEKLNK